jgi:hypothetical protein
MKECALRRTVVVRIQEESNLLDVRSVVYNGVVTVIVVAAAINNGGRGGRARHARSRKQEPGDVNEPQELKNKCKSP